jgi:hypothetical protein
LTDCNFQINKNKNRDNVMDIPPSSSNFTNRGFQYIRDAEPEEIERYRRLVIPPYTKQVSEVS